MNKNILDEIYTHISQANIARHFKINQSAVSQWHYKGIPADRVAALSELTNYKISCHQMRPDVFRK